MKKNTIATTMTASDFIKSEEYANFQQAEEDTITDFTFSLRVMRWTIEYNRPNRKIIIKDDGTICGKLMEVLYKEWCIEQKYRRW